MFIEAKVFIVEQITIYDDEPEREINVSNLPCFIRDPNAQL